MPPKFDPNEVKILDIRVTGGIVGAASSLFFPPFFPSLLASPMAPRRFVVSI
jgi:hypothetical protein